MKYFTKYSIVAVTAVFVFVSVFFFAPCGRQKASETPIKIGINVWSGYAHAFIAEQKGFFKKNGVNVELVLTKEFPELAKLYRDGKVDGLFEVFTDSVFHNSEGIPTKVVCVVDYSDSGDVIVARPEVASLLNLKEKPVGIGALNSFSHLFVLSILKKAGVKEGDMRFKTIPPLDVLRELEDGKIYAGHTWEPATGEALKKGYKILAKAGDIPGIIVDVLSFNEKLVKKRPADIRAVVKSLFEAQDFVRTNRAEALAIMAKAEGMTTEEMESGLGGVAQLDLARNKSIMKRSDDPNSLFNLGRNIYEFYGSRGRFYKETDLDDIIDPSYLE